MKVLRIGTAKLSMRTSLAEPATNNEATQYLLKNYKYLVSLAIKHGCAVDKANDLVHDMFISLMEDENNGEGFDADYGTEDRPMDVAKFVCGRLILYCKNVKYSSDVSEYKSSQEGNTYVYCASFEERDSDAENEMVGALQTAMRNAATYDNEEEFLEANSIREQIDFCIDVASLRKINLVSMFKNIDLLGENIANLDKRDRLFDRLRSIVKENDEFGADLLSILEFSRDHRETFDKIMMAY